jgi:hypothetical protein
MLKNIIIKKKIKDKKPFFTTYIIYTITKLEIKEKKQQKNTNMVVIPLMAAAMLPLTKSSEVMILFCVFAD